LEKQNQVGTLALTEDGSFTLAHPVHGETYHSSAGAMREALELYIAGSGLLAAVETGRDLVVIDVGLGLGYNALSTIQTWIGSHASNSLKMVSMESNLDLINQLVSGQGEWQAPWTPEWLTWAAQLRQVSPGQWAAQLKHPQTKTLFTWQVFGGDARNLHWSEWMRGQHIFADFIWQDAFSPKVCLELWTADWFQTLRRTAKPGAKLLTYSVARAVRDSLAHAGWIPKRIPGTGTKRHWLMAINTSEISSE
jgi:tRNA 5-methylaminomethyl-2-thiouridine biosynthesis bifunctional protein